MEVERTGTSTTGTAITLLRQNEHSEAAAITAFTMIVAEVADSTERATAELKT